MIEFKTVFGDYAYLMAFDDNQYTEAIGVKTVESREYDPSKYEICLI